MAEKQRVKTQRGYAAANYDRFFTDVYYSKRAAINAALDNMCGSDEIRTPEQRKMSWKKLKRKYGFHVVKATIREGW